MATTPTALAAMPKRASFWIVVLCITLIVLAGSVVGWLAWSGHSNATQSAHAVSITRSSLSAVQPPPTPQELTGSENKSLNLALVAYERHRYGEASSQLAKAAVDMPVSGPLHYLMGACFLLTGDHAVAINELRESILMSGNPYADAARILLAKAYLNRTLDAQAKEQLRAVEQNGGPLAFTARQMLEQIEVLRD